MTRFLLSVSALALTALPRAALAQEPFELDPLTFYGSLTELPLSRTGTSVDVVEEDELRDAPVGGLTGNLSRLPGVTFTSPNGPGGLSYTNQNYTRIRGLDQKYAPVLLNGIDISDPSSTQTSFDWNNILAGGATRVEVVRGSQSALYGSEAVAGVIAVTAAQAPDAPGREGSVSVEVGAYETRKATLSYGIATERAGIAITASRATTDGFSAFSDDDEDDGFAGGQYSFDTYYDISEDLRVGLTGFRFDSEFDYDPAQSTGDTRQTGLRAYVDATTGAFRHQFDLSRFKVDRNTPRSFVTSFEGEREEISYLGTWTGSDAMTVSYGIDRTEETAESFTDEDVTVRGAFGEIQYFATPDLDLALSVRHDDNSQFGGFTTGRGALSWRPQSDLTIRATLANGFRAPSLNELYGAFGANPDLDPETSRSADLGIEKSFANGASLSATLFYTEIDDLIQYTSAYNQVDGTSVSQGLELAGQVPVTDRITLTGAFTYTDARDSDDDPLQRVPRYALDLGIDAQITERLTASALVQRRADLPSTFPASSLGFSRLSVDDYTVVNAQMGYRFDNDIETYLRVENLFDEDYEVIPGYETSDRAAYFGIRASF